MAKYELSRTMDELFEALALCVRFSKKTSCVCELFLFFCSCDNFPVQLTVCKGPFVFTQINGFLKINAAEAELRQNTKYLHTFIANFKPASFFNFFSRNSTFLFKTMPNIPETPNILYFILDYRHFMVFYYENY